MLNLFSPLPVLPDVPAEKEIWIEKLTELLSCARSESVEGPVAEAEALYYFDSITSTNDHMKIHRQVQVFTLHCFCVRHLGFSESAG